MRFNRGTLHATARAVALAMAAPAALPVLAQSGDEGIRLEEVTVTARKVEENQMTVPMAITALTGAELEATGAKQLNDIMAMTPSFYFSNQQGASGRIAVCRCSRATCLPRCATCTAAYGVRTP